MAIGRPRETLDGPRGGTDGTGMDRAKMNIALNTTVTREQKTWITGEAIRRQTSISAIVREALEAYRQARRT